MKFRLILAGIAAFLLPFLGMTPPAHAAEAQFNGWVTWAIPDGGNGDNVKYPQPFIGLGEIGAEKCGVTNQHDYLEGPKAAVEKMWADKLLQHGEDSAYVKKWYFTTGDCKITRTFQVDTLRNSSTKLAKKAAGYDNDGRLKWGEDRPHYGHSSWQTVKVRGYETWMKSEWMTAINKATTKKGVGSVNSLSHASGLKKGSRLTTAWEIVKTPWKKHPQVFFARGVK